MAKLIDYHIVALELQVEDAPEIWSGYNARLEEWRCGHLAETVASDYERFGFMNSHLGCKKNSLHTTGPHLRVFFYLGGRSYFRNFAFISETDTKVYGSSP